MLNNIRAVMFGHAVGDALGVPVEFRSREYLRSNPIRDMIGFGTYNLPAGCWSDDTSMALCTLDSLSSGVINYDEIMRNFGKWYYDNAYTPEGFVFDIGNTSGCAIDNYFYRKTSATNSGLSGIRSNGNGSLMRIHPFVLYSYYNSINDEAEFKTIIAEASSLTHAHPCSIDGCMVYSYVLKELLDNPTKDAVYIGLQKAKYQMISSVPYYGRLLDNNIDLLDINNIRSSGYVVDSLEAAIWCLLTTETYRDCVLKAVNLGEDTDTVAAIAGGLAGALYGFESIPQTWLNTLKRKDYIDSMCKNAYERWCINGI